MTLPKKGIRKIAVNGLQYGWCVKATDEGMNLSIVPMDKQDNLLSASFGYLKTPMHNGRDGLGLLVITSSIVRQCIMLAFEKGWDPLGEKAIMKLRKVDDKVTGIVALSWISLP